MKTFKDCLIPVKERTVHLRNENMSENEYYRLDRILWNVFEVQETDEPVIVKYSEKASINFIYENTESESLNHVFFKCSIDYFLQNNPLKDYASHFLIEIDRLLEDDMKILFSEMCINWDHTKDEVNIVCYLDAATQELSRYHFGHHYGLRITRTWDDFIIEP